MTLNCSMLLFVMVNLVVDLDQRLSFSYFINVYLKNFFHSFMKFSPLQIQSLSFRILLRINLAFYLCSLFVKVVEFVQNFRHRYSGVSSLIKILFAGFMYLNCLSWCLLFKFYAINNRSRYFSFYFS